MQILVKLGNGKLAFIRPVATPLKNESETEYLTRIGNVTIAKCARDGQSGWAGAVIAAFVPDDVVNAAEWAYRDGWDWTTPEMAMDYDMVKCRAIHRERMRKVRAGKFTTLDAALLRELENGDPQRKAEIAVIKQALRDVPSDPAIDAAKSIEELKAVWPDVLK